MIPGQDIFLDSSHAEGLCHTWGSAFLFESQVSSDSSDSSFFSDPVRRWEVLHHELRVLTSGTFRIVALFRWLWLELVLLHDQAVSLEASLRVLHQ